MDGWIVGPSKENFSDLSKAKGGSIIFARNYCSTFIRQATQISNGVDNPGADLFEALLHQGQLARSKQSDARFFLSFSFFFCWSKFLFGCAITKV